MKNSFSIKLILILFCMCFITPFSLYAAESKTQLSKGQLVYVPAYSDIYIGNKERPFPLTVTLSIRNIDPKHKIKVTLVDYYETKGKLIKKITDKTNTLEPLESLRYIIPQKDMSGGAGANFMVEWHSDEFVNPPIIESIMIGTHPQGISFTSRGQEVLTSK